MKLSRHRLKEIIREEALNELDEGVFTEPWYQGDDTEGAWDYLKKGAAERWNLLTDPESRAAPRETHSGGRVTRGGSAGKRAQQAAAMSHPLVAAPFAGPVDPSQPAAEAAADVAALEKAALSRQGRFLGGSESELFRPAAKRPTGRDHWRAFLRDQVLALRAPGQESSVFGDSPDPDFYERTEAEEAHARAELQHMIDPESPPPGTLLAPPPDPEELAAYTRAISPAPRGPRAKYPSTARMAARELARIRARSKEAKGDDAPPAKKRKAKRGKTRKEILSQLEEATAHLTKQRLKEIILEEIGDYSREEVNKIINAPRDRSGSPSLREPWDGIEENAERLDILSNQIGKIAQALGVEL